MKKYLLSVLIPLFCIHHYSACQMFTVTRAPFSSDKFDEYSPVFYDNGIVFCTNRNEGVPGKFSTSQDKGLFSINFIKSTDNSDWKNAKLFSREITSRLNDGPVTFSRNGDTVYFSRNLVVEGKPKELESVRNKLGIFYAVKADNKWTKVRELRFNNEWFNLTTPYLSPDGNRLYFASDKDGGFGGSDLYYCNWKNGFWDSPVNLGPVINTKGNEAFPFVTSGGELFFSSDGHPGMGGKDIYYSRMADTSWIKPILLEAPVNSTSNDFGLVFDSTMSGGYFSTDRGSSLDIYSFRTRYVPMFYCEPQHENTGCFSFSDDGSIGVDPLLLEFEWHFSTGEKIKGPSVEHCFPGPGEYIIDQYISERKTARQVFKKTSLKVRIEHPEQPYITSGDTLITGQQISLDGDKSHFRGERILSYNWEIDTFRNNGNNISYVFNKPGQHTVRLGLLVKDSATGLTRIECSSKTVHVFNERPAKSSSEIIRNITSLVDYRYAITDTTYSAGIMMQKEHVFQAELIRSPIRLGTSDNIFRPLPSKYHIKEIQIPEDSSWSYIIDEQSSLMEVYPAFRDAASSGFKEALIKTFVHTNPAESDLTRIRKMHNTSADIFFGSGSVITFGGMAMLEQIALLMKKYPSISLLIANHTDNRGGEAAGITLTRTRSEAVANYLSDKGIETERLLARGYGSSRPVSTNLTEDERRKNRRIEFVILDNQ
jgi:outer membrane protein OmpA-like peptidoglycan-associated protein